MASRDDDETHLERVLAQLEIRKKSQTNNIKQTKLELSFDVKPHDLIIKRSFIYVGAFNSCVVYGLRIDNCIIMNCKFENCTLENVTLSNCFLKDTDFVDCNFSDVLWQNLRKEDETIVGQDWENDTTLVDKQPSEISNPQWLGGHISLNDPTTDWKLSSGKTLAPEGEAEKDTEAASPSPTTSHHKAPDSPEASRRPTSRDDEEAEYVMPEAETSSQDAATGPPPLASPKPFTTMTRAACERWFKEKNRWGSKMSNEARNIVRRSRGKAFPFMYLPAHVRIRVYDILLRPSDIVIVDRPQDYRGPAAQDGQLQYEMWNMSCGKERAWPTTYLTTSSDGPDNSTMIKTAILRTNKRVYREAVTRLYDRKIIFNCSAEGALSWMHDISKNLSKITTLVFTYRLRDSTEAGPYESRIEHPKTRDRAFRYLINTIVHKCDSLHYFGFRIDKWFWSATRWNQGASEVLESEFNSYLLQVARLAHYDHQQAQHQPGNNGIWLQFFIEKAEHHWKKSKFKDELERAIQLKRADRPKIAYPRPCNGCKATTYDECCFVKLPINERTGG